LLCALVCDEIRNILILGDPGTAKSTLVRSVESLTNEKKVITIPQNITYDRLLGMIDLEKAITSGSIQVHYGILKEGNNQILYADDINLMDEGVIQCILTTSETGQYLLEREGLSQLVSTRFTFIASMDPSEGKLSSGQLDRFDLCIRTDHITDSEMRSEIVRKSLNFETSPDAFILECEKETETLKRSILKAKERLPYVSIPDGHADLISSLCVELGIEGYRGDIAVARTAKALAALDQRDDVMFDDIKLAALLALEHRRGEYKERPPHPPKSEKEESSEQDLGKTDQKNKKS
jgi:Mg-chelatase subunit ChlI